MDQKSHKCVCIETTGEIGLIFCPDFPKNLTKVDVRNHRWCRGSTADIKCTPLPSGQLKLFKVSICSRRFTFYPGTLQTIVRVRVEEAPSNFLPFTQIGFNEELGHVLLPNAWFDIGEELNVKVQYNDYFIDGIYWIALEYKIPDERAFDEGLKQFSTDLRIPIQSLIPRVRRIQLEPRPSSQQSVQQNANVQNNTRASRPTERSNNVRGNQNEIAKSVVNSRCILKFPPIDPNELTTVIRGREDNQVLVLKKCEDYAIGFTYPFLNFYTIIGNTINGFNELVEEGAYLDVSLAEIQNRDIPYKCVATTIYKNSSMKCRTIDVDANGSFVFCGIISGEELKIDSIDLNAREQKVRSDWGYVLFDNAGLRTLQELQGQRFNVTVQHMRVDADSPAIHWVAIPGKIQQTTSPNPDQVKPLQQNDMGFLKM
ncbi:hypothetical protein M3Y97_00604500 [Aphelenchoides bicaudatus]|nr:hypothetical protein M3Y97_00604500 [Aphelenchoides bicaudatus]